MIIFVFDPYTLCFLEALFEVWRELGVDRQKCFEKSRVGLLEETRMQALYSQYTAYITTLEPEKMAQQSIGKLQI